MTAVSEVMIVDPNRGNRPVFSRHMAALGYTLEDVAIKSLPGAVVAYSGRLLHYRRS